LISLPSDISELIERGGTLIVPSRQRAHAVQLAHAAQQLRAGRRVWTSPDALPLESWLARELERRATADALHWPRLLSATEEWWLWREATAEATDALALVNPGTLAEALLRSDALAAEFAIDLARLSSAPGAEWALLGKTRRRVEQRCESLGAARLANSVARLSLAAGSPPIALQGFLHWSPRLQELARRLAEAGIVTRCTRAAARAPAVPSIVIAGDELDELERVADWCCDRLRDRADARLLIVAPGAAGRRERLATLIRQAIAPADSLADAAGGYTAVAIEGGEPLALRPSIAHALATLEWLAGGADDFSHLSVWLLAPYWARPEPAARARLELWLRERAFLRLDVRELLTALRAVPTALAKPAQELRRQLQAASVQFDQRLASPRSWSERFRAALSELAWPGTHARGSAEQQSVLRFGELLDEFGQLAGAVHLLSAQGALRAFTELAARTAHRPADEDAAVTISPMLADPVVRYDGIWVTGLDADSFPRPAQPDPFLPLTAQLAASIPQASPAGRLTEARALLAAWRAAADELVLSAPARTEDLALLPSPLLGEWPQVKAGVASIWLPLRMHREGVLESYADEAGRPWPPELSLPHGARSLELQNSCPFRAYAELRLGSVALEGAQPGVGADVRGRLLHAALQNLWQRLGDSHALQALPERALDDLIEQCVAAAGAELERAGASGEWPHGAGHEELQRDLFKESRRPAFARELRRAARLIRGLCELERARPPFTVQATERECHLAIAGARLNLRVDRIDALEQGGRAILDYKSGRRAAFDWFAERPSHVQLLAYLAAAGEDVIALSTVHLTAAEIRFDGIARSSDVLPRVRGIDVPAGIGRDAAWAQRRHEWRACVARLASDFLAGAARVDPKPGACDYCHVVGICRIADRDSGAALDLEAGDAADE